MIILIRIVGVFIGLCLAPTVFAEEKLIFAVDVIRHGDRTHIVKLPTSTYLDQTGPGQLTAIGMRQAYELGSKLRDLYIQQQGFLPEKYLPETIYVQSTDTDRTVMSAQSLLIGLYPPGTGPTSALPYGYQPIPIYTIDHKRDEFLKIWKESELLDEFVKKEIFTSSEWQEKIKELKPFWPYWSEITGIEINSLDQLMFIADTLKIYKLHGVPLPEKISDDEANKIIEAGKWVFVNVYKNPKVGYSSIKNLLHAIVDDFNKASQKNSRYKYKLISAHDTTLMSFMSLLGVPVEKPPKYASHLHMGLFKDSEGRYWVKSIFNQEPIIVPACGGAVCSLEQFVQLLKGSETENKNI